MVSSVVVDVLGILVWMSVGYMLRRRPLYAVVWFALFPVLSAALGVPVLGVPSIAIPLGFGPMVIYGLWGYLLMRGCGDNRMHWLFAGLMLVGIRLGDVPLVVVFTAFMFWTFAMYKGERLKALDVLGFALYAGGVFLWFYANKYPALVAKWLELGVPDVIDQFPFKILALLGVYIGFLTCFYDLSDKKSEKSQLLSYVSSALVFYGVYYNMVVHKPNLDWYLPPHYMLSAVLWLLTLILLYITAYAEER